MTISELLKKGTLSLKTSQSSQLDSEILLCKVLNLQKENLITKSDTRVSLDQIERFEHLIQRRKSGTPIAYLIEEKEFFGRTYYIDKRVLIPRPETEEMLESCINHLKSHKEISQIIDIGTGSGCIAITLSKIFPERTIIGSDISKEALEVALINIKKYKCKNIQLILSDLLEGFPKPLKQKPTYIIANLPYIGRNIDCPIHKNVKKYEPHIALFSGEDGLDHYRKLWKSWNNWPNIHGLCLEISPEQIPILKNEISSMIPKTSFKIHKDLSGSYRFITLERHL